MPQFPFKHSSGVDLPAISPPLLLSTCLSAFALKQSLHQLFQTLCFPQEGALGELLLTGVTSRCSFEMCDCNIQIKSNSFSVFLPHLLV